MGPIFWIILAGALGTSAMTLLLYLVHGRTMHYGDAFRALGSFSSASKQDALAKGLFIHYLVGIIFAFIYFLLLQFSPVSNWKNAVLLAGLFGLVHGMVVGLWVTIFVAESHPLKRFKESGWPVAAFYVVAHLLYGLVIGIVLGFFALDKMGTNPISY